VLDGDDGPCATLRRETLYPQKPTVSTGPRVERSWTPKSSADTPSTIGQGGSSLMAEQCPESVDLDYLSTEKWRLESASEVNRQLGGICVRPVVGRMRKLLM